MGVRAAVRCNTDGVMVVPATNPPNVIRHRPDMSHLECGVQIID